ncbi:MAG: hypothetical protein HZB15_07335 [Actinobacteria bacterium]|nr:hypothetical protein [Actinomycetota bacterium]
MKTMTCRQLGGACDLPLVGEDANEIIHAQDRHLREAVAAGGVDHDPAEGERTDCTDHAGREDFPWCYEGHDGTDFMLAGGFPAMDRGSAEVVAAADGVVERAVDGNYTACSTPASMRARGEPSTSSRVRSSTSRRSRR